jgi:hypothetical protein
VRYHQPAITLSTHQLLRNPNLFSKQVVQNLYDISGAYPIFRIGGSTQNSAVYYPDQSEAIIDPFDSVAADQPEGTQYIYGKTSPELHHKRK